MSEFGENKIWSAEDIVNNASTWSLSADKELLKHLQHLSEKILSNAAKTNDNLVELMDDLEKTGLSLDLVNIKLETLHHTQFIESRVYEDDDEFEANETKETSVKVNDKAEEEKTRQEIEEGIIAAIQAVEEYYEYKEVPNSDSDDETDSPNFVWQPKDPYLARPLPYIIGTTEWYRKWHVGLLVDSSDDEDANQDEKVARTIKDDVDSQSSDDERYLPQSDRRSTMALDRGNINNQCGPSEKMDVNSLANSTSASTSVVGVCSEKDPEDNSLPIKESNASFTEQLAQKLGNVAAQARDSSVPLEINTKPIQKAPTNINFNIFFDEPPPLNDNSEPSDDDDLFSKHGSSKRGIFGRSESGRLFDDDFNENDSYWGPSKPKKQNRHIPNTRQKKKSTADISPVIGNILDNENESEDDLFTSKPAEDKASTNYLPKSYTTLPLFDDEPPPIQQEEKKKKPIGGVSIFGNTDIMKPGSMIRKLRRPSSSDTMASTPELDVTGSINKATESEKLLNAIPNKNSSEIKTTECTSKNSNKENVETEKVLPENWNKDENAIKNVSLFDESDSLFEDDLFSNVSNTKFTSSLFEDDDTTENDSSSLFYTSHVSNVKKPAETNNANSTKDLNVGTLQKPRLFDDVAPTIDSVRLNNEKKVDVDIFSASSSVKNDLFNTEPSKNLFNKPIDNKNITSSKRRSLFEDDNIKSETESTININKPESNEGRVLFDDFASEKVEKSENKRPIPTKRRNLFEDDDTTTAILPQNANLVNNGRNIIRPNLFDETPKLYSDSNGKSVLDNEGVSKIEGKVIVEVKDSIVEVVINAEIPPILTIPTKNVEFIDNIFQKLPENVVQSVLEPDLCVRNVSEDIASKLTHMPLFDTPPEIEDDFDTDSEHNLFNDENHLLPEDDSNDLSLPVHKISIFDDEPPLLLLGEQNENITRDSSNKALPSNNIDNYDTDSTNISVDDDLLTLQLHRSNLSIHERLNIIRTPIFDTVMEKTKDKNNEEERNNVFSNKMKVENAVEDYKPLGNKPIEIHDGSSAHRELGVPGKLKHNLDINVANLLPDAHRKTQMAKTKKRNALDEFNNTVEILQCITKDRAKIPTKRRPSMRRARKEISSAIFEEHLVVSEQVENNNATSTDDIKELPIQKTDLDSTKPHPNIEKRPTAIQSEAKPASKGVLNTTTSKKPSLFMSSDSSSDSDDIFQTMKPKTPKDSIDIFIGSKAQSLFDKQPVIKGDVFESPDYKKSRIFFDDDDESTDDYFSSKKLPPKSNIMKKNLFDDEEEGDDLFQSTMFKNDLRPAKVSGPVKKSSKTTSLFPVTDATDDPLDLFK